MPDKPIFVLTTIGKQWIYPALVWIIFVCYEVFTAYMVLGRVTPIWTIIPHYAINILFFYINALVVLPKAVSYKKNKAFWVLGFIVLELLAYVTINFSLNTFLESFKIRASIVTYNSFHSFVIISLWRFLYFLALSISYWLWLKSEVAEKQILTVTNQQLTDQKKQMTLEKNILELQNAYMHSQLNPHLYFNTLNFIYNTVYKVSPKGGEAVMLLSDISRYALSQVDINGKVSLCQELENINNIIKINQIRFDCDLCLTYDIQIDRKKLRIIPLALISIAENVFKYGEVQEQDKPAFIKAYVKGDCFYFETENFKKPKSTGQSTRLGLENTRVRLQNAYDNNFDLTINKTQDKFNVQLWIKLECLTY